MPARAAFDHCGSHGKEPAPVQSVMVSPGLPLDTVGHGPCVELPKATIMKRKLSRLLATLTGRRRARLAALMRARAEFSCTRLERDLEARIACLPKGSERRDYQNELMSLRIARVLARASPRRVPAEFRDTVQQCARRFGLLPA